MKNTGLDKSHLIQILGQESQRSDIRNFNPIHILVNVLALSIFPFIASPILKGFLFDGDLKAYDDFIDERTEHIVRFVKSAIFINN